MKVLIVSDSPAVLSGLGRVVRELARRFHEDGDDVVVGGWFHAVAPPTPFPYPIVAASKERPVTLEPLLRGVKPDVVLAIGDPQDFVWLSAHHAEHGGFRLVGYLTVEARPFPLVYEQTLDGFDALAIASEFGRDAVGRPGVVAIHLGVDRGVFRPLKRPVEFLGRQLDQTFVVLLNGQNTPRKNLGAAVGGFARFAAGKDDTICYANTQMMPVPGETPGQNLADVMAHVDIKHLMYFNPMNRSPLSTVNDASVNATYAISDVLLVTSCAEGFGLPILESMATQTVPLAPAYSSCPELLADGRGELIPVGAFTRNEWGSEYAMVSEQAVAEVLDRAYWTWKRGELTRYYLPGMAFAMARPWDRTYRELRGVFEQEHKFHAASLGEAALGISGCEDVRVADGRPIDRYLRIAARRAVARHSDVNPIGVLKLGGLGDMLQTTTVVRAAARKYGSPVVVFSNRPDVFEPMEEVVETVPIREDVEQDILTRSVADCFPAFLDVRYVSRVYDGTPRPEFSTKHGWFFAHWGDSNVRIADLGLHTTALMLRSLGLETYAGEIRPIYEARDPYLPVRNAGREVVAIATGAGDLGGLKRWPVESWEAVAAVLEDMAYLVVQVGGENDPPIAGTMDCRGLGLPQTADVLEHAKALISIENGMVHLAKAVGTRAVVLFGPTPVVSFGYAGHQNLSTRCCPPCFWGPGWFDQVCPRGAETCVNMPSVEGVLEALELLVDGRVPREIPA